MNCKKCGAPIVQGDQFCKNCGATVNAQNGQFSQTMPNNQMSSNQQNNYQSMGQPNYQNMGQPNYSNNYGFNQNYHAPKQNGNIKYIIIGIVISTVIFALILLVMPILKKDKNGENSNIDNSNVDNSDVTVMSNQTYNVNYNGFTLKVPNNLIYEKDYSNLYIGDEKGSWLIVMYFAEGSFSQIIQNKSQFIAELKQQGYNILNSSEKNIDGMQFLTMEASLNGENAIIAIAKVNSMYFALTTIIDQNNEFDYDHLDTLAQIIKSAEMNSSYNISLNNNFDISQFINKYAK